MTHIILDLEQPSWPDLKDRRVTHLGNDAPPIRISPLEHGTLSGKPSIAIRLDLPDGQVVVVETTLNLFRMAAAGLEGWRQRVGAPE